jgi:hypothetical protein
MSTERKATVMIARITRDECWRAAGTQYETKKSARRRGQSVEAFGRDVALTGPSLACSMSWTVCFEQPSLEPHHSAL